MPLTERQLVIPAMIAMHGSPNFEITTTDLIAHIRNQFALDTQDLSSLVHRNDEKFTQIVRNLKSHKRFNKTGWAEEIKDGFRLTPGGEAFLRENGFID